MQRPPIAAAPIEPAAPDTQPRAGTLVGTTWRIELFDRQQVHLDTMLVRFTDTVLETCRGNGRTLVVLESERVGGSPGAYAEPFAYHLGARDGAGLSIEVNLSGGRICDSYSLLQGRLEGARMEGRYVHEGFAGVVQEEGRFRGVAVSPEPPAQIAR